MIGKVLVGVGVVYAAGFAIDLVHNEHPWGLEFESYDQLPPSAQAQVSRAEYEAKIAKQRRAEWVDAVGRAAKWPAWIPLLGVYAFTAVADGVYRRLHSPTGPKVT